MKANVALCLIIPNIFEHTQKRRYIHFSILVIGKAFMPIDNIISVYLKIHAETYLFNLCSIARIHILHIFCGCNHEIK